MCTELRSNGLIAIQVISFFLLSQIHFLYHQKSCKLNKTHYQFHNLCCRNLRSQMYLQYLLDFHNKVVYCSKIWLTLFCSFPRVIVMESTYDIDCIIKYVGQLCTLKCFDHKIRSLWFHSFKHFTT